MPRKKPIFARMRELIRAIAQLAQVGYNKVMDGFDPRIGKLVSRRSGKSDAISDASLLLDTISRLRGGGIAPIGIYRFSSFDEAELWALRRLARPV